jgi:hypothetical protein
MTMRKDTSRNTAKYVLVLVDKQLAGAAGNDAMAAIMKPWRFA